MSDPEKYEVIYDNKGRAGLKVIRDEVVVATEKNVIVEKVKDSVKKNKGNKRVVRGRKK